MKRKLREEKELEKRRRKEKQLQERELARLWKLQKNTRSLLQTKDEIVQERIQEQVNGKFFCCEQGKSDSIFHSAGLIIVLSACAGLIIIKSSCKNPKFPQNIPTNFFRTTI